MIEFSRDFVCPVCHFQTAALCDELECPGLAGFVSVNSARACMGTFMGCQRRVEFLEEVLWAVLDLPPGQMTRG